MEDRAPWTRPGTNALRRERAARSRAHGVGFALAFALVSATLTACERAPLDNPCPTAVAGELVLTELRGEQAAGDTYGQWIEIFNASDHDVELGGLQVVSVRLDGSGEKALFVRDDALRVAPGAYATLGSIERDVLPAHLDYSFAGEALDSLETGALLSLRGCGETIDEMVYRELPSSGSWSLDGNATPSAELNDDESRWCVDDEPPGPDAPTTESGIPGTPRAPNRSCTP